MVYFDSVLCLIKEIIYLYFVVCACECTSISKGDISGLKVQTSSMNANIIYN